MAVIGSYLGASGLGASGFVAVFVFGIALGNKEVFGLKMGKKESERLMDHILTTSLVMRMFVFIQLGSQVNFSLMEPLFCRRCFGRPVFYACCKANNSFRLRPP